MRKAGEHRFEMARGGVQVDPDIVVGGGKVAFPGAGNAVGEIAAREVADADRCARCGSFVVPGAGPCGRVDCPIG